MSFLLDDEFDNLLRNLRLSSSSSTAKTPSDEVVSVTPPQHQQHQEEQDMTTAQRLDKLGQMRTSMQQKLILLLVKVGHAEKSRQDAIQAQIEECKDLLGGLDGLIWKLRQQRELPDMTRSDDGK